MADNVYELRARQEKVVKMVAVLDRFLVAADVHPFAVTAAADIEGLSEKAWKRVAQLAGCNAPSPTTIAAIVAIYRDRPAHVAAVRRQSGV
jgi:hypothetical protein